MICVVREAARACALVGFLLAAGAPAHAEEGSSEEASTARPYAAVDYEVDFWTTEQGLLHNTVNAILQTRDEYLWVGTAGGLVRFDGLSFTPIGESTSPDLKDARITALLEDDQGTLWVGTQGSGVFGLQQGQVHQLTAADGLADNAVTSLAQDPSGAIWIGTQRGLNKWQNAHLETFASDGLRAGDAVVALHAGRSGVIWITTRAEVYKMRDGKVESFRIEDSTQEGNAEMRGAYEDRLGNLWTFSATFLLNLTQGKRYNAFRSLDPASSRVWSISEQDDGTFWIGTSGRGLVRFYQGRFDVVGTREGLDQCDVRALFSDRAGNLWIGTSGNGLARLRVRQWRIFNGTDGLVSQRLTSLAVEPNGQLWIGTEDAGLLRFTGTSFESFGAALPLNRTMNIQSLCMDRGGALWAATWGNGVIRMAEGRQWRFGTAEGLSDDVVNVVVAEPESDAVWVGTRYGSLHRISATNVASLTVVDGLTGTAVRCLLFTRAGRLVIGSDRGGLMAWDGQRLAHVPSPPALAMHTVRCLAEDSAGHLWVGTTGEGAFCRADGTWLNLSITQGLPSDVIGEIVQDGADNMWFGSDKGVFQVREPEVNDFLSGKSSAVTSVRAARDQGVGELKCAAGWPAAAISPGGVLWFAANGGLLLVDPFNIRAATAPPVMIERVSVDGQDVPAGQIKNTELPLELGPGIRSLDFSFTAISFNAPEKTRFRHRMEGFDLDWVPSDAARKAHYGPLPPGRYRFRVLASSADEVWNETGAAVSIVILPPVWQSWWFITLCSVALVGTIWQMVRFVSLRRLHAQLLESEQHRAMERERTRIAQDMHDEIGSKLTRISFLSEVARQGGGVTADDGSPIEAISNTSRELLQALDEIVWAVNPRNDSLEHLAGYLEQYAREYFQMTPVECIISMPPILPEVELTAEVRHNVFLAYEEALGNALKHANPTQVRIQMNTKGTSFEILVKDDGQGFDAHDVTLLTERDGLRNMETRLRIVGGKCEIVSEPGKGTTVRMVCPLANHASMFNSTSSRL